ncbi:Magnesium transporter MgtE [Candidatus Hepatincolaceae symbiont of Richtersius coronifer]
MTTKINKKVPSKFYDMSLVKKNFFHAIKNYNFEEAINLILLLDKADTINLLEQMSEDKRKTILFLLDTAFFKEIIFWLPNYLVQETIDVKGVNFIVDLIHDIQNEDLPYFIVKDLEEKDRGVIVTALSEYKRKELEKKLKYPTDSAGRLMQSSFVSISHTWMVSQTILYLRELEEFNPAAFDNLYDIFIVDDAGVAVGSVALAKLLISKYEDKIMDIKSENFKTIETELDQEEVALVFRDRGFVTAGVVDAEGVLMGIITIEDVVDVIYKEAEEDFALVKGGIKDSGMYRKIFHTAKLRIKWLGVNCIGIAAISTIIPFFSEVLSKYVVITALLQFVAALGGNAGLQTLSITIRNLSLKLLSPSNAWAQISKEFIIALITASALGVVGCIWGLIWGHALIVAFIAFIAVWINILLGTLLGIIYPLLLKKLGIDPAISSSMCVTTSTDFGGFLIVLSVASLLLN